MILAHTILHILEMIFVEGKLKPVRDSYLDSVDILRRGHQLVKGGGVKVDSIINGVQDDLHCRPRVLHV